MNIETNIPAYPSTLKLVNFPTIIATNTTNVEMQSERQSTAVAFRISELIFFATDLL